MRIRIPVAILLIVSFLAACAAPAPTPTPNPTLTPHPSPTPTAMPTPSPFPTPEILATIGRGIDGRIDQAAVESFLHLVVPQLIGETSLSPEEISQGKILPVQEGKNALVFFYREKMWHFRETSDVQGYAVREFSTLDCSGLDETCNWPQKLDHVLR